MSILISPDSFKGSLSALEVSQAIEKGVQIVNPDIATLKVPLADGGEGTMEAMIEATEGEKITVETTDALGRTIQAQYGITGNNNTAIVELAAASGLDKLDKSELNPSKASTYGTGILIRHAIENGSKTFIICLGGSATNDGGLGLLKALGFEFKDKHGTLIGEGGLSLKEITEIDDSQIVKGLNDCEFKIACDVTNPFIGENGASYVFGPQKGASTELAKSLDKSLHHFADIIKEKYDVAIHNMEGAGAAGGVAGGLCGCLNAELYSGFDLVASSLNLNEVLNGHDIELIITGEGQIDSQTENGKVISGITTLGYRFGIPSIALVGGIQSIANSLYDQGLIAVFSIANKPMTLSQSIANTADLITKQTEQIMRLYSARR
ncbi:glycerate kinase [Staphylococcus kloosii]|jgi:glycerate kinase|uniref:glycerate kinase n=1 Tax=Staphylococcus kloosii TaxID=29384 RepID=UPI00189DFAF4|nr:glycerate kinase [Staphylococcus kloosii]MBF7020994.1 glycerate kinase [Staphylococcus kloosii]MCD8879530.1 glycerate kinase [Staphylococcus kloosii]